MGIHSALLAGLVTHRARVPDRSALLAFSPETEIRSLLDVVAPDETPAPAEPLPEPEEPAPAPPVLLATPQPATPPPPEPEEFEPLPEPRPEIRIESIPSLQRNRRLPRALRDRKPPPVEMPDAFAPPAPAPRPERPPAASAPSRGGPSREAMMSEGRCSPPRYPALAQARGWEGRVLLRVSVDARGRVTGARVEESSGHEILDEAAREAVLRWRFEPALEDGLPVACEATIPVRFALEP